MSEEDIKRLSDGVYLANGKKLDVVVKGRFPLWHECQARGHFKIDCFQTEHSKVQRVEAK